ncbi:hypothetical protein [Pseudomonas sp. XK-1]|uniref:hypothetical protein n=1 Tax=Pseudomonas sp. XK-1 TaxID=3136019 RepID=UPI003119CBCE
MTLRLPPRESLSVEFKSDLKKLPDRELIEALVCLANAEGGEPAPHSKGPASVYRLAE